MVKSEVERLKDVIAEVMTLYHSAVSKYGYKEAFGVLKKNPTYGFNEMNLNILFERLEFLSDPAAEPPAQPAKLGVTFHYWYGSDPRFFTPGSIGIIL